jgi:hypothetical protein
MANRSVEHHEGDGPLERSIFASFARWIEQQLGRSTAFWRWRFWPSFCER